MRGERMKEMRKRKMRKERMKVLVGQPQNYNKGKEETNSPQLLHRT